MRLGHCCRELPTLGSSVRDEVSEVGLHTPYTLILMVRCSLVLCCQTFSHFTVILQLEIILLVLKPFYLKLDCDCHSPDVHSGMRM